MKILPAKLENGIVSVDHCENGNYVALPRCPINSEGKGDSKGFAIINEFNSIYVGKITLDIYKIIDLVIELGDTIADNVLESNGGGNIAPNLKKNIKESQEKLRELKYSLK